MDEYLALGEKLERVKVICQTYNPNDIADSRSCFQSTGKWFKDNDGNVD